MHDLCIEYDWRPRDDSNAGGGNETGPIKIMALAANAPKRVLQLVHCDEAGGVEALAAILKRDLSLRGASVETFFMYPSIEAGPATKLWSTAKTLVRIVRYRPDTLISYQSTASVLNGVVGRLIGIKTRIVHQTAIPDEIHPLLRAIDRWVGAHNFYSINIANSHATEAAFAAYPEAYRQKFKLIEHGIEVPKARSSRSSTLARYAIPDDGPILLNSGRLSDQKAQDVILRALPMLPLARLVLAGGGPLANEYFALARQLGVQDRVHMHQDR